MITSVEIENGSLCDPDYASFGRFVNRKLGINIVDLCAKLNDSSFSRSRDIIGGPKI